jgi:hypothetical protein
MAWYLVKQRDNFTFLNFTVFYLRHINLMCVETVSHKKNTKIN